MMFPSDLSIPTHLPAGEIVVDTLLNDENTAWSRLNCRALDYKHTKDDIDRVKDTCSYGGSRRPSRLEDTHFASPSDRHHENCLSKLRVVDVCCEEHCSHHGSRIHVHELDPNHLMDAQNCCHVRLVFMKERDHSIDCIHAMSKSFSIPPPFWDYYTNGSFGSRVSKLKVGSVEELYDDTWLEIALPVGKKVEGGAIEWSFNTPSFLLKWRKSSSTQSKESPEVFFFSLESPDTPHGLEQALCKVYEDPTTFQKICEDPFGLFAVVLSQWFAWNIELFYTIEEMVIRIEDAHDHFVFGDKLSRTELSFFDFSMLHRISKHNIQFLDTIEVAAHMQKSIQERHSELLGPRGGLDKESFRWVESALKYHDLTFFGAFARVKGLSKRMKNQINLAFNLVQQRDARITQGDSQSMTAISILTLFFLPSTAVASIFSMPFFYLDTRTNSGLHVFKDFRLFWAVAVPFTTVILLVYWWRRSLANERPWAIALSPWHMLGGVRKRFRKVPSIEGSDGKETV